MKTLLITAMIFMTSTVFAQSIEQHSNKSQDVINTINVEKHVSQKTREQVLQELIQAKKDGTMDRLNELYKGGQ